MRLGAVIRMIWIALGFIAMGLGILGIFLPLLPTTVFLLMAAYCFARSSPRLHDWLVDHPAFGPPIVNWRDHKAIATGAKIMALGTMAVVLIAGAVFGLAPRILLIQAVVMAAAATYVATRPTPPPD